MKIINTRQKQRLHKSMFSPENELSENGVGPGLPGITVCSKGCTNSFVAELWVGSLSVTARSPELNYTL